MFIKCLQYINRLYTSFAQQTVIIHIETRKQGRSNMKIRDLLYVLFNLEKVGIFTDTEDVWSGYACAIPQEYYDSDIDVVIGIQIVHLYLY